MKKGVIFLFLIITSLSIKALPREEYPRPQFERKEWINLNGEWNFTFDFSDIGFSKNFKDSLSFSGKIIVPFAPESKLSGVGHTDFINAMWYQRKIDIPQEWIGKQIMLNFGAVYYESEIYLDGNYITTHYGGSSSFSVDLTKYADKAGEHNLVVRVKSDLRNKLQPAGKQSTQLRSHVCNYTRTTGIWQTVWMEAIAKQGLKKVQVISDIDRNVLIVNPQYYSNNNCTFKVTVKDGKKVVSQSSVPANNYSSVILPIKNAKLWSPESPFLYDITYEVIDEKGKIIDIVSSYIGMRKIHIENNKILLNNKPCFLRMVLDQGFYPDGNWTAPSDDALRNDILLGKSCGFNGARLHQKVFEERFHYWADKLGYLTCGEFNSWGLDYNQSIAARIIIPEWTEIIERDKNHPSIIMWIPNNEQNCVDHVNFQRYCADIYDITKLIDPTRPVHTNSGGMHFKTDIYSNHRYGQDSLTFYNSLFKDGMLMECYIGVKAAHEGLNTGSNFPEFNNGFKYLKYENDMPYLMDEYGGISFNPKGDGWGYGGAADVSEFYKRAACLTNIIVDSYPLIFGYCYTQLTDVEQEQNGLFYYDRTPKFDIEKIKEIFSRVPQE